MSPRLSYLTRGGAGKAVAVEPGIVDGDRQGPYSEELDGADIVQRLHERKRHARGERWASERQPNSWRKALCTTPE